MGGPTTTRPGRPASRRGRHRRSPPSAPTSTSPNAGMLGCPDVEHRVRVAQRERPPEVLPLRSVARSQAQLIPGVPPLAESAHPKTVTIGLIRASRISATVRSRAPVVDVALRLELRQRKPTAAPACSSASRLRHGDEARGVLVVADRDCAPRRPRRNRQSPRPPRAGTPSEVNLHVSCFYQSSFSSRSFAHRGSGSRRVVVRARLGVVERLAADRAEAGAVGPAEHLRGQREHQRVVRPGVEVELALRRRRGCAAPRRRCRGWSTSRASTSTATRRVGEAAHARARRLAARSASRSA